jgi:hypothetical protein
VGSIRTARRDRAVPSRKSDSRNPVLFWSVKACAGGAFWTAVWDRAVGDKHAFLLLRGGTEFRNVASISTLVLMLEFSIGLLFGSIRLKRAGLVESNSVEREGWK